MPSKRFLMTSAPFCLLALAGMGLATAQSSSPFAAKKRAQAWEQQPAASAAPQSWSAPAAQTAAHYQALRQPAQPQTAYSAPAYSKPTYSQAPVRTSYSEAAIPASSDAPIATTRRRNTVMQTASTQSPPKTFGGRPAAPAPNPYAPQNTSPAPSPYGSQPQYGARNLAGAAPRPAANSYAQKYAQAPDLGSPTPPSGQGQAAPPSGSPYAPGSSRRVQAWETPPVSAPASAPQVPQYQSPQAPAPQYQGQPYPAQTYGAPPTTPPAPYTQQGHGQQEYGQPPTGYAPNSYSQPAYQSSVPPTGAPYPGGPYGQAPQAPRSWAEKLGLKNLATIFRGKLTVGGAGTYRDVPADQLGPNDGWSDDEIADAELEFEVSAITDGGLEYGAALGARAQYDAYRRGFGGQLPDCPAGTAGCSGTTDSLRGHTSGFYNGGEDITTDAQIALESAHLFLRSAYGDVTLGRDDGSAYLFSLGAPSLLAVGASNSPVDYTGLDSVKTVNDASGFAEKVTYTSPRLLGDQIGLGVQFGVSYALDGDVCGVDYCNGRDIAGILQPEIEDILEAGVALDRTFDNGLRAELTGTYARGSEQTGGAEFDDLESFGAGVELEYGKWTLGSSYLQSNNGLLNGDYTAYDVGLTWKPSALGFTLGYGHAEDDNVGLTSDQGTFGITYDFDKFTLGTGVQYVDRRVNGVAAGIPTTLDQKAASIFVQGGFKF